MSSSTPSNHHPSKTSTPTYEKTRRLRVWLNHSLSSPVTFENHRPSVVSPSEMSQVRNIDDALKVNYHLTDFEIASLSLEDDDNEEEWTYDGGHRNNKEHLRQLDLSRKLKQQLKQSPLDFSLEPEELEQELKWKYGTTGSQEFQFATFENMTDFKVDGTQKELQANSFSSDDDFGDFQEAEKNENHQEVKEPMSKDVNSNKSGDEQVSEIQYQTNPPKIKGVAKLDKLERLTRYDVLANVRDDENDVGFGNFQKNTGASSMKSIPANTPKSTDGVSTILDTFQLDFSDFPTPNNNSIRNISSTEENQPQNLPVLSTSTIPSLTKILMPRNAQTTPPDSKLRKKSTALDQPVTPIIHNQSAKKPLEDNDLCENSSHANYSPDPDEDNSITEQSRILSPSNSPVSMLSSDYIEDESSIPSVVQIVATNKKSSAPLPTVLFPNQQDEQEQAFFLSHQAMQTPEGRFLRRQFSSKLSSDIFSEESDGAESVLSLQRAYFDEDNNHEEHVVQILKKLEWDWIPYWQWDSLLFPMVPQKMKRQSSKAANYEYTDEYTCDGLEDWMIASLEPEVQLSPRSSKIKLNLTTEENIPLFQNEIVQQLSHLDLAHVKICKQLYEKIQPHSVRIQKANTLACDLGKNLQLCDMYLQRSIRSVKLARQGNDDGEGAEGARELLQSWQVHSAYTEFQSLLDTIQSAEDLENMIEKKMEFYDESEDSCRQILKLQLDLHQMLNQTPLSKLDCMDALRDRCSSQVLKKFQVRLHSSLESIAVSCCSTTPTSTFSLKDQPNALEERYHQLVQAIVDVSTAVHSTVDHRRIALEICTSLQTAWLLQSQRSFGLALLDPTDDSGDSEYDKELLALGNFYDINIGGGLWFMDPAKLSVWTQNLVTIRLDFEIQTHPLPAVIHKLCVILFHVLYGYYTLWSWHTSRATMDDDGLYQALDLELSKRRPSIWNSCIEVFEECLEEYLNHVSKKHIFDQESIEDDSDWLEDLEGLHDVVGLVRQFLSLKDNFLDNVEESNRSMNDGCLVEKKLDTILQRHIRAFHINAMTSMGTILYKEDWTLVPLKNAATAEKNSSSLSSILYVLLEDERSCRPTANCRSRCNLFVREKTSTHFANFAKNGNPFHIVQFQSDESTPTSIKDVLPTSIKDVLSGYSEYPSVNEIFRLLSAYCDGDPESTNIVPKCFSEHAVKWISRLLMIIEKLPSVTANALDVLENICGLYTTTAFRICAGSFGHEQTVLGIQRPPIPDYLSEPATPSQRPSSSSSSSSSSSPYFSFKRRSSETPRVPRITHILSPCIEAELCAPVMSELESLNPAQGLIINAQQRLESFVKLDLVESWIRDPIRNPGDDRWTTVCRRARILEKRHAVSWSCVFLAALLHVARCKAQGEANFTLSHTLDEYTEIFLLAIPKLLSMSNRMSCLRAVDGRAIVQEIIAAGNIWEEAELHEHANGYVEAICDICSLLWSSLHHEGILPRGALETFWEDLLSGCYISVLDGFSRLPFCSTEGRALMSIDLATLTAGMDPESVAKRLEEHGRKTKPPPQILISRGMPYVDTYIKIFYFPPLDALNWIAENRENYQRQHAAALIAGSAFSFGDGNISAVKMVGEVKALYDQAKPRPSLSLTASS